LPFQFLLQLTELTLVASTCMLPQCCRMMLSKIECRQLHSELFRCSHRTLQSHGLFVLAKHVLRYGVHKVFGMQTHSLIDGQTRMQYDAGTVFNG